MVVLSGSGGSKLEIGRLKWCGSLFENIRLFLLASTSHHRETLILSVCLVQMPVDFPALAVVLIISLLFFVFTVDSKKATDKPRDKGGEPRSLTSDPVAVPGLYFYLSL